MPPLKGTLRAWPSERPPSEVMRVIKSGVVGEHFQGGEKSGLFLAAILLATERFDQLPAAIEAAARWFELGTKWKLDQSAPDGYLN